MSGWSRVQTPLVYMFEFQYPTIPLKYRIRAPGSGQFGNDDSPTSFFAHSDALALIFFFLFHSRRNLTQVPCENTLGGTTNLGGKVEGRRD